MAKPPVSWRAYFQGLLTLFIFCAIAWFGIKGFWNLVSTTFTDSKVMAAVVTGSFSVIAAAFVVVFGRHLERKKEIEISYRQKRTELYDEFLSKIFSAFTKGSDRVENMAQAFRDFNTKAVLWASPNVLKAYYALNKTFQSEKSLISKLHDLESFLQILRHDLGLSNKDLNQGDILRIFINDYDEYIQRSNAVGKTSE